MGTDDVTETAVKPAAGVIPAVGTYTGSHSSQPLLTSVVTTDGCIYTPIPLIPEKNRTNTIPVETLIAMSRRENELRYGEKVQRYFKHYYALLNASKNQGKSTVPVVAGSTTDCVTPMNATTTAVPQSTTSTTTAAVGEEPLPSSLEAMKDILEEIQRDVLEEFGFKRNDELRLYELRTAAMQHPEVQELQDIVYIKHNRCSDSFLYAGDSAANVPLVHPTTFERTSLFDVVKAFGCTATPRAVLPVAGAAGETTPVPPAQGSASKPNKVLMVISASYS